MNSEKVKEIKENLNTEIKLAELNKTRFTELVSVDLIKDILTLINELGSENETIRLNMQETEKASFNINQMNGNLVIENQQLKDRIAELEEYIKGNEQDAKAFVNGWHKDLETELKQFVERLKESAGQHYVSQNGVRISDITYSISDGTINKTLKEFIK